jgi:hypothetical protein
MNQKQTLKLSQAMEAWCRGIECQVSYKGKDDWSDLDPEECSWDSGYDYRIKPEPMEIEVWVHPDGRLCSDGNCGAIHTFPWGKKKFREVLE